MLKTYNESGMSLLEVLIALSLLGLITVMVMGGVTFGTQVWASNERAYDLLDNERTMERVLRRHISHTLPIKTDDGRTIAFEGTPTALQYLSNARVGDGAHGIHGELIRIENGAITLWTNRALLSDLIPQNWAPHPLKSSTAIGFQYLDVTTKTWRTNWLQRDRLPALILVHFKGEDTPVLILSTKVTLSGLSIDQATKARLMRPSLVAGDRS